MGDRYYMQQKAHKPGRMLKKDVIYLITRLIGKEIQGLDKCTIATLNELLETFKELKSA